MTDPPGNPITKGDTAVPKVVIKEIIASLVVGVMALHDSPQVPGTIEI